MSPAKLFGVVIRSFGLMLFFYSVWYIVYGVATVFGLPEQQEGYKIAYFISGFFFLVASFYLLKGAKLIVKFCYPEENP